MPLTSGTPRWQKIATFVLLAAIFGIAFVTFTRVGTTNSSVEATNAQGARRDCVTSISTARNAVFTDVQIDTAISTQLTNGVLLRGQVGPPLSADEKAQIVKTFGDNNMALTTALVEARRLQPAPVLDGLIAHGGLIAGVHYDACPN